MKVFLTIIRYILIVILAVSILGISFISIASSTILDKNYALSKLEETNYYSGIYEEIKNNFEKYIYQSGLDESVITDIITEEKVRSDVNIMIDNIYDGTDKKIDCEEIRTKLNNNIEQSVENKSVLEAQKEAIDEFVNIICDEYTKTLTHTEYEQKINNQYLKIMEYIQKGKKIILGAIVGSALLILAISYNRIFKAISSIGIASFIVGLISVAVNIYITTKIKINTLTILNGMISSVLRTTVNEIVGKVATYGYIFLAAGIVAIIVGNMLDAINYREE